MKYTEVLADKRLIGGMLELLLFTSAPTPSFWKYWVFLAEGYEPIASPSLWGCEFPYE